MVKEHSLPVRRACRATGLSRTAWYRRPVDPAVRDREVIDALLAVVERHGRWGFWKCFDRLRSRQSVRERGLPGTPRHLGDHLQHEPQGRLLSINAVVESFSGTLKQELVHRSDFVTRAEAKSAIFAYIEVFYNRWRWHSYLA